MKVNSKGNKDLVFLDSCTKSFDSSELKAFSGATFVRNEDIELSNNAKDSDILKKISEIQHTGEYRCVVVITQDKGNDGDKTFTTDYPDLGIVYSTNENLIEKLNNIKDLKNTINWYTKIHKDKIVKIRKDRTGKILKHIKRI